MIRTLLACALALVSLPSLAQRPARSFAVDGDHFTLDGRPFKVISGELHYARIPREYWHARLKMARAMGLNTIATYVFWNLHEPRPGVYDFTGQNDLRAFIQAAHEEGLYVILRAGPYVCAEWEMGGLPSWLLADPKTAAALRSDDPAFLTPVARWITRLNQEVGSLQIGKGGPILVTQVENEYGGFGSDHVYMQHMVDLFRKAGFNDSLLDTVDGSGDLAKGAVQGIFSGVNFGIGNHKLGMDRAAAFRPGAPIFVTEYWPGWFDSWGHPHQTRPTPPQLEDVDYILSHGAGLNLYMFHGGTSFGFMSGADTSKGNYLPDTTSYDYGAPLDESGRPTPKYFQMRAIIAKYSTCSARLSAANLDTPSLRPKRSEVERPAHLVLASAQSSSSAATSGKACLPPVPTVAPPITIPTIFLSESTPLWHNLPTPISSPNPLPMESPAVAQSFGYILYRTQLPAAVTGDLALTDLHDYAQIYIDGKLAGTLDRRLKQSTLPIATTGPARLDILVEDTARINYSKAIRTEQKGITQSVTLAGDPLTNWQIYSLPMTKLPMLYSTAPAALGSAFEDDLYARLPAVIDLTSKPSYDHCGFAYGSACPQVVYASMQISNQPPQPAMPQNTATRPPTFYRAHFTVTTPGDTFLDVRALGKGVVWINGHNLGRFWNVGPQDTLYLPGPWLKQGQNEIVVFDLKPSGKIPTVAGLAEPILNAPVADRSGNRKQE